MRLPELRRFTLSLIGPRADPTTAGALGEEGWATVDRIAQQHRLRPFLQARIDRGSLSIPLPPQLQPRWREALRHSAIKALASRKAALEMQAIFQAEGIRAVALKGLWCAWQAYASAAERPMRDIDLLLAPDQAIAAFQLLRAHGFRQEEPSARTPEESLSVDKHLPPLVSPDGQRVELHMRLWERHEAIGWWMPEPADAAMLDRAVEHPEDGLTYLAPEDMLAHFIIHAIYSNRLNGGPLGLVDIDALIRKDRIDWKRFWQRAEQGGWHRGAALALHLVEAWRRPGMVEASGCPMEPAPSLLASAPDLLLQDLSKRKTTGLAADLAGKMKQEGPVGFARAALKRAAGSNRARTSPEVGDEHVSPSTGPKFSDWFARRAAESARALADPEVRNVSRCMAQMGQWLEEPPRHQTRSHGDEG